MKVLFLSFFFTMLECVRVSLSTSQEGQDEEQKKRTPSMMTMKSESTSNRQRKKNDPKNSARKTRDFLLLVYLGFFFYKWMNEVWSLFLFFFLALSLFLFLFPIDKTHVCRPDDLFFTYGSLFFLLFLFYVWRKE